MPLDADSWDTAVDSGSDLPLLQMQGICKSFPGVRALHQVDLDVRAGQVLALLGENGAGKSTLIKMLGGAHAADSGTIRWQGQPVRLASPADATRAGIGVIYQEFNLIPELSAAENIFLGHEGRLGPVQRSLERQRTVELLDKIGALIPLDRPCRQLSIAQQQMVEIAKALALDARLLVMDEPSATLTPQEVDRLLQVVTELRRQGIGIIYISHRLDEIFAIADRVTVLRDGETVGSESIDQLTRQQLIAWMVGRTLEDEFPPRDHTVGAPRLQVDEISGESLPHPLSLTLHAGEILGVTGLVGAGRTELARLIFGADRAHSGQLSLDGRPLRIRSPRDAIAAGICLLTEDRKHQGLVLDASVLHNFGLPNLRAFSAWGLLRTEREQQRLQHYTQRLKLKASGPHQLAGNLSGGNQQKLVLAKWLQRNAEVIIFDEPTRGIDVGAKYEIYQLMHELARQGKAIMMISSELPEILGMSDRVLVMHAGRVTGEIRDVPASNQTEIMELAVG